MKIHYNNLADSGSLTAFSQDDNFPVQNVQNYIPSKVYKTSSAISVEAITIDLGTDMLVTCCLLYNHNFDGTQSNFLIQGTDDITFASVPFSQAFTPGIVMNAYFARQMYRYWRITFTKANSTDVRSIGRVFLGDYFTSLDAGNPDYDGYTVVTVDPSVIGKSLGGQTYAEQKNQYRTLDLTFTGRTDSVKQSLDTIFDLVGTWKPIFVQMLDTSPMNEILYVRITNSQSYKVNSWQDTYSPNWNFAISLEEQI